ncbi:hypothetical protein LCGC14_2371780 [marine sediment metagenome]|uniref:Uncharacterized protein n=1 Tax=marine sediment metagenome TaxID=412755 RepID=A0A0F9EG22_9ZZZZ
MAKWRARYKAPDGSAAQTIVELDVTMAKEARLKIIRGECDLFVQVDSLIMVERMSDEMSDGGVVIA